MFGLTREVRFAVNADNDSQLRTRPSNSFGGFPTLMGIAPYLCLRVTLGGKLDAATSCLRNIKDIDLVVRRDGLPLVSAFVRRGRHGGGGLLIARMFDALKDAWSPALLINLELMLSPYLALCISAKDYPMVTLSQKFEFCAAHRLHNPALTDEQNRLAFGKCNNPNGHGHNYVVEVAISGKPDADGLVMPIAQFEELVSSTVIDHFDHRNLNNEVPEFAAINPTVENIAMVIHQMLKPKFPGPAHLARIKVWETTKTWCEYSE